jgi:2-polyprenyl-3-methyl-5-hydroxy-6-metoxy-1,4-benzoquinol methylase
MALGQCKAKGSQTPFQVNKMPNTPPPEPENPGSWDHSSHREFVDYYARQSLEPETVKRFTRVRDKAIALLAQRPENRSSLQVADIGCGAGTQSRLWAQLGHHVHGLDVNAPLIEVARQRAEDEHLDIEFAVGSATELPYADKMMDVSLLPELLEHVVDWESVLNEAARILKPGGLLFLSTTNWLCPKQDEFELPLYSWYPGFVKRKYEHLAVTTRPEIVNHAKYPAVNWFSFYSLSRYLGQRGFRCLDRFDLIDTANRNPLEKAVATMARTLPPLRFAGHLLTPGTVIFAFKQP